MEGMEENIKITYSILLRTLHLNTFKIRGEVKKKNYLHSKDSDMSPLSIIYTTLYVIV